ncbi:MAG: thiolase family protein [Chloroflexi bacterium]|nr:thiolase family protein [Chloroflexota bacterium]
MRAGTQCAIVGSAETEVGKLPGRSALQLRLEAAVKAIEDAGLDKHRIDGLVARQPMRNPQSNYSGLMSERLGIEPSYTTDISLSGAGSASMVLSAVSAIQAGICTTVLCVGGDAATAYRGQPSRGRLASEGEDFRSPFGADGAPVMYALAAQRHMYEYGTKSEQFGAVAVACRRHASLNPNAQMRTPITIQDHQSSKFIVEPFRLLDCSLVSDGAGAIIVTTAERAQDLPQPPVQALGMGNACRFSEMTYNVPITTTAAPDAARRAFRMAGVDAADVDFAELYDCFTPVVVMTLEDYGFCGKGEGGAFVESGRIELGGELPVNTHGGLLSQAHIGGMLHITEAVTQLRHQAGERQVDGARVGVVSGQCGELGIHVTLVLGADGR